MCGVGTKTLYVRLTEWFCGRRDSTGCQLGQWSVAIASVSLFPFSSRCRRIDTAEVVLKQRNIKESARGYRGSTMQIGDIEAFLITGEKEPGGLYIHESRLVRWYG